MKMDKLKLVKVKLTERGCILSTPPWNHAVKSLVPQRWLKHLSEQSCRSGKL